MIRTFSEMEPVAYLAGDTRLAEAYYLAGCIEDAAADPDELRADVERLNTEVDDAYDEINEKDKQIDALETKIEALQSVLDDIFDLCGDPPRGRYKEIAALTTSIDR